ncbi:hypothetical protein [Catellatospora citrea]|uniref:Uncharacterized protein n=1 Tax=Catellatospora citrea TaxID=53366 RepID=A0A8J3KK69_9ACTN|nr:hypothetical protein [Catellatospora citrea]RKE08715.1 hypothetical protein C8E86_3576 [Catellatospora citrea]GIG01543.1 hypothetical protein Cci01nite_66360 [Catellatospora citrea]
MLAQAPPHHPSPAAPVVRRLHGYQLLLLVLTAVAQLLAAGVAVVAHGQAEDVIAGLPRTVVAPGTLGGRPRDRSPAADGLIADAMRGQPVWEGTAEVKAVYGDPANGLLLHAVAGWFDWDTDELTYLFYDLRVAGIAVVDIDDVPAGPLGGYAACGHAGGDEEDATVVCAWTDEDSVGTFIWFGSSVEAARAEFIALRGEVEVVKPVSEW